jgi:hypothetical protein
MDFKHHFENTWNITITNLLPLVFMTLLMVAVSVLTVGFLAPVAMAGYTQSVLLLVREGREPRVQDVFSQMKLFLPLLAFSFVAGLIIMAGCILLVLPGVLLSLAISFFCLFMLPLMTDKSLGLMDAVKKSAALSLEGQILDHIIVTILYIAILAVGGSIFFVGILFTQPLATVFLMSVFEEKIKDQALD